MIKYVVWSWKNPQDLNFKLLITEACFCPIFLKVTIIFGSLFPWSCHSSLSVWHPAFLLSFLRHKYRCASHARHVVYRVGSAGLLKVFGETCQLPLDFESFPIPFFCLILVCYACHYPHNLFTVCMCVCVCAKHFQFSICARMRVGTGCTEYGFCDVCQGGSECVRKRLCGLCMVHDAWQRRNVCMSE